MQFLKICLHASIQACMFAYACVNECMSVGVRPAHTHVRIVLPLPVAG